MCEIGLQKVVISGIARALVRSGVRVVRLILYSEPRLELSL